MKGNEEIFGMSVGLGCRGTIVTPKAFKKMKVRKTEHVGKKF